ncbi:MAG TPA: PhoU domain-containing protein [Candidatus Sulfotelmatobacter sp.]|nr:PhoU domain-containing protein [Candidatus Sulfotelmatobacter sp.]
MPRKTATSRPLTEDPAVGGATEVIPVQSREAARKTAKKGSGSLDDLTRTGLRAFLIARDAAFNVKDLLTHSSRMAFLAIKECEQELDVIERYIDDRVPAAITRVNEIRARQLLTSLKCTTNLERIGDLMMSVALRMQSRTAKMAASDLRQLVEMSAILREMLDMVYRGFLDLDLECARKVLQMDKDIDRVCHALFQKHLTEHPSQNNLSSFDVILMAQALERAGDHTTNLAEDLYSLIEGRSLRHPPKKRAAN